MATLLCVCGSNKHYKHCCLNYLDSIQNAITAEQLMRSRYTAYIQQNSHYVLKTWHPTTRPNDFDLSDRNKTQWTQLYIVKNTQKNKHDKTASVEFVAYYLENSTFNKLHEVSQFIKTDNKWFYVDGKVVDNSNYQPGRNSPCYCGSGKKYKLCCLV